MGGVGETTSMTSTTKDGQKVMINNGLISTRLSRQATSMMKMANAYWNSLRHTNLTTSLTKNPITILTTTPTTSLITILTTSPITAPTTIPTTKMVTSTSCHHLRVALLTWL